MFILIRSYIMVHACGIPSQRVWCLQWCLHSKAHACGTRIFSAVACSCNGARGVTALLSCESARQLGRPITRGQSSHIKPDQCMSCTLLSLLSQPWVSRCARLFVSIKKAAFVPLLLTRRLVTIRAGEISACPRHGAWVAFMQPNLVLLASVSAQNVAISR